LQSPDAASLQVHVSGTVRKLHPLIYEEVMAIAERSHRQCLSLHASANKTEVLLHYSARELRLSIRDDGPGIPADVIAAGGRRWPLGDSAACTRGPNASRRHSSCAAHPVRGPSGA
jgi:hypothetical protein